MRPRPPEPRVRTISLLEEGQMAVQTSIIDENKLNAFLGQLVGELGATVNAGLIVLGDRLGLYKAMAQSGPITSAELAEKTGTAERYIREGAGLGCHEHDPGVATGCERFFRPGDNANLVSAWLPALDGIDAKLRVGAKVADVGCGLGASTRLMAQAYPRSKFTGFDYHQESIALARQKAKDAGLQDSARFEIAPAAKFPGNDYDLVAMFDCLHDMGDPVGAARHVRQALAPDGTWLIVEPSAGDRTEQNFNPVGRAYYAFSTFLCTPSSLSQDVGLALGAQAGEARIRDVATAGGFTRFRRVAETPFNLVYEARP